MHYAGSIVLKPGGIWVEPNQVGVGQFVFVFFFEKNGSPTALNQQLFCNLVFPLGKM